MPGRPTTPGRLQRRGRSTAAPWTSTSVQLQHNGYSRDRGKRRVGAGFKPAPTHKPPFTSLISVDVSGIGPLVELDIHSPRVGDEGERAAGILFGVRPIELHPVGFELLDEGLQV